MDGAREGEVGCCCCCIKGCMGSIFSGLMLRGRGSGRREDEEEEQEKEEAGVQGTKWDEDMWGTVDGGGFAAGGEADSFTRRFLVRDTCDLCRFCRWSCIGCGLCV